MKVESFIIINLSPSGEKGTHWTTLYKDNIQSYYYFDSLGCSPDFVRSHFKHLKGEIFFLEEPTQAKESIRCGEFVVYFIAATVMNFDFTFTEIINSHFTSNTLENEKKVMEFISNDGDGRASKSE